MIEKISANGTDFISEKVKSIKKGTYFGIPLVSGVILVVALGDFIDDSANYAGIIIGLIVGLTVIYYIAILPTIVYTKIANNIIREIQIKDEYLYLYFEKPLPSSNYAVVPINDLQITRINTKYELEFFKENIFLIFVLENNRYYFVDYFWDNKVIIFDRLGINC